MEPGIGKRIRALRQARELTQEELARRADLTKGFISQIEGDRTSLSLDSLIQILKALDTSLASFFTEEAEEKVVFTREDWIQVTDRGPANFALLIPGGTNRRMDPVLMTLKPRETMRCGEPHEGEEFGYVLSGKVSLMLGGKVHRVREGECFYYQASREHSVVNSGRTAATLLWIPSPAQM